MVRSKWELLKKMVDFLSPFDVCTNLLGGENYTTANCVVPFIFDLEMHTESYKENEDNTIAGVAEELNMELKRRFGKYMMSDAEELFLVAMLLDPTNGFMLKKEQSQGTKFSFTRSWITLEGNSPSSSDSVPSLTSGMSTDQEPSQKLISKKFRYYSMGITEKMERVVRSKEESREGASQVCSCCK